MVLLLGDMVTVSKSVSGELTYVTGRVSGIVQDNNGDLERFYIRGIGETFWLSNGWKFELEEYENDEGEEL